jgi:hypothetical protein
MRRKMGLILVFGAALPLVVASAAWACGVLATLTLDSKVVTPGQAVTLSGKNYANPATTAGASAVTVRLKSRTGTVLTTVPATGGKIADTFTVPSSLSPGWYVVLATQTVNGVTKSGTPGRTTMRVSGSTAAVAAPWSNSTPSGPTASHTTVNAGSGNGSLYAILLAAGLSLSMLAGGWKLLSRRGRRAAGDAQLAY